MLLKGHQCEKICHQGFANNEGADQPAHPHRLISAFVIRFLESIISRLATREISIFWLVSVVEETGLSFGLSETPKTAFVASRPKCVLLSHLRHKVIHTKTATPCVQCSCERCRLLKMRNKIIFFLFLNQNICCEYSKEPSQ